MEAQIQIIRKFKFKFCSKKSNRNQNSQLAERDSGLAGKCESLSSSMSPEDENSRLGNGRSLQFARRILTGM
jgi:hypothetical protein